MQLSGWQACMVHGAFAAYIPPRSIWMSGARCRAERSFHLRCPLNNMCPTAHIQIATAFQGRCRAQAARNTLQVPGSLHPFTCRGTPLHALRRLRSHMSVSPSSSTQHPQHPAPRCKYTAARHVMPMAHSMHGHVPGMCQPEGKVGRMCGVGALEAAMRLG